MSTAAAQSRATMHLCMPVCECAIEARRGPVAQSLSFYTDYCSALKVNGGAGLIRPPTGTRHCGKHMLRLSLIEMIRILEICLLRRQYVEEVRRAAVVVLVSQFHRLVRSVPNASVRRAV